MHRDSLCPELKSKPSARFIRLEYPPWFQISQQTYSHLTSNIKLYALDSLNAYIWWGEGKKENKNQVHQQTRFLHTVMGIKTFHSYVESYIQNTTWENLDLELNLILTDECVMLIGGSLRRNYHTKFINCITII